MLVLFYAFSVLPALWGLGMVFLGLIGFVIFVIWEMRQQFPVLRLQLFQNNTTFAFSNLAALLNYVASTGIMFLLSLYLQYVKGFSAEHTGFILITMPVVMVICSPIAGNLSDKIEPRIISSIGMAFTTAGQIMLAFLTINTNLPLIFASLIILGIGFGLFVSPNSNAIMSSVERKYYGVASGTLGTMRLTGQALSLGVILLLFSIFMGQIHITPDSFPVFMKTLNVTFIIFAALCFGAIFVSMARGKIHQEASKETPKQ